MKRKQINHGIELTMTPEEYAKFSLEYKSGLKEADGLKTQGKPALRTKKFSDRVIVAITAPKWLLKKIQTNINEMTTGAMASSAPSDGRAKAKPDGWALGSAYFNVDGKTFSDARLGRGKGKRWHTLLGKSDTVDNIRAYARKNGNPDIMLRNSSDGSFMFAQRGIK